MSNRSNNNRTSGGGAWNTHAGRADQRGYATTTSASTTTTSSTRRQEQQPRRRRRGDDPEESFSSLSYHRSWKNRTTNDLMDEIQGAPERNYGQDYYYERARDDDYYDDTYERRGRTHPYHRDERENDDADWKNKDDTHKEQQDYEDDLDEFGRVVRSSSFSQRQQEHDKNIIEWPPPFEESGASYVFDARSAMFYEAMSDFFYDPKSKLYFGNKTQVYYTYCRPKDDDDDGPPFRQVAVESQNTSLSAAVVMEQNLLPIPTSTTTTTTTTTTDLSQKTIAIKLTSKVLPGHEQKKALAGKTKKKTSKDPPSKKAKLTHEPARHRATNKQDVANIEKWSERGREERGTDGGNTTAATPATATAQKSVPKTASGQPICMLCRRKFATLEKLLQHEKVSALHKENLEKKQKALDAKKQATVEESTAAAGYRDRALERRVMHGPETQAVAAMPLALEAASAVQADVVRPEDNLGDSNIGNQMLQKLGWKSGGAIGRQTKDNADSATSASTGKVQNALVKDWERIESMAGRQRGVGDRGAGIGN